MKLGELRVRDPFLYREGDSYYLLGTTGNDPWHHGSDFILYRSDDLMDFHPAGRMAEEEMLGGYSQFWAPELYRYGGKYYLLVSMFRKDKGRGCKFLVSDRLNGKFVPLTEEYITPAGWTCLDATLFLWHGTPYLCFSNEWVDAITHDGDGSLYIAELSADLKKILRYRKIVSGKYCGFSKAIENEGIRGYVAEGPFLEEEDGQIALYWSTYTENGYCVARSKANEPFGEYRFNQKVFDRDGGHCMIISCGGRRKLVLHRPNTAPLERAKIFDLETLLADTL